MNYITDGTFWVIVLIIAGAIWVVWYLLNKKLEDIKNKAPKADLVLAKEIDSIKETEEAIVNKIEKIEKKITIHDMYLGLITDSLDEKTQKKMMETTEKLKDEAKNKHTH